MRIVPSFLRPVPATARRLAVVALAVLTVSMLLAGPVLAAVVNRIEVTGTSRVEPATVKAYLTIQPGKSFGPADISQSIDRLYATGLFTDVAIAQQGNTLVVRVTENPIISQISFEGNRRLSNQTLQSVIQTQERSVLTKARVQADVQAILNAYRAHGNYEATVVPKIINRGENRVDLVFEINEGPKTVVAGINFVGNHAFSDSRLADVIKTRIAGLLGFIRTTDVYDPERLASDEELLRQFYYNHGYADFRIVSATADFDRERNAFFITFTLDEGPQYKFGAINVNTTLSDLKPAQLRRFVLTNSGQVYSALKVEKTIEALTLAASSRGYPFAQVRPRAERNFDTKTISIDYSIEEGPRAYIERINIIGNTTTRDYVIRREFDIVEGDAYNKVLIDRAKRRLNNLGFFENVRVTTEPGSEPDRVIVNVYVVEKSTGSVSFGAGYSTHDGIIGDLSIEERNFLGRGQYVKAMIGGGQYSRNAEFDFTEPYFLGRHISAGFTAFYNDQEATDYQPYNNTVYGGSLKFGFPITENTTWQVFYNLTHSDVNIDNTGLSCALPNPTVSLAICDSQGNAITSAIGTALIYNSLDNIYNPHEGIYARYELDFAGVGGDVHYFKNQLDARIYQEIIPSWGVVGMLRAQGGAVDAWKDHLRVQDQFFVGGDIIRGFETSGIGPRDALTHDALGGRYFVAGSAETNFPVPYVPREVGLRAAVFTDVGSLWGVDPALANETLGGVINNDFALRWSAGVGILWASPFGPIRADFAWPIMQQKGDRDQVFRISGGTTF